MTRGRRKLFDPHRLFIGRFKGDQALSLVTHFQATIQMLAHFHFRLGIAAASRSGWNLQAMTVEGEGVVVGDRAAVLEAEEVF